MVASVAIGLTWNLDGTRRLERNRHDARVDITMD
jgi:hypothetical protein